MINNEYEYPFHLDINYETSNEYRQCIRKLFCMDTNTFSHITNDTNLDNESRDELEYDEEMTTIALNYIFNKTKDYEIFRNIYTLASNRMFSNDLEIGLTVLLSYDYLIYFHKFLQSYFINNVDGNNYDTTNENYVHLYNLIK
jgi:hypothetical protein